MQAMNFIARFLITPVTLLVAAASIPGVIVESAYIAIIVALLLAVINVTLKPILLLLTLPINILTLGLFTFIINAAIVWFLATFVAGFAFSGFLLALLTALLIAVAHWLANRFF